MTKKVLVIGNISFEQIHHEAKKKGYKTILISDSPKNIHLADKNYACDAYNSIAEIKKIILTEQPDFIISRTHPNKEFQGVRDQAIKKWAEEYLSIPVINTGELASLISYDKAVMRLYFHIANLPLSKGYVVEQIDQFQNEDLSFPLVVKRLHSSSGLGVYMIHNQKQLSEIESVVRDEGVIIEEFQQGIELGLEVIKTAEEVYFYPPAYLGHTGDSKPLTRIRYSPMRIDSDLLRDIHFKIEYFLKNFFKDFIGVVQFDLILHHKGWIVNELNSRPSAVSDLNDALSTSSPFLALIQLGEDPSSTFDLKHNELYAYDILGEIESVDLRQVREHPSVSYVKDIVLHSKYVLTVKCQSKNDLINIIRELPIKNIQQIIQQLEQDRTTRVSLVNRTS